MNNKRFFSDNLNAISENYNSFNGEIAAYNAEGMMGTFNATASNAAPKAKPYSFTISNTTTDAVTDVTLFNALVALRSTTSNLGLPAAISVAYGTPGFVYEDFLRDLVSGLSFHVNQTYFFSASSLTLNNTYEIMNKNTQGTGSFDTLTTRKDPYQQQQDCLITDDNYIMDKMTKLTIAYVAASASLKIEMYPTAKTVNSSQLIGVAPVQRLETPRISIAQ